MRASTSAIVVTAFAAMIGISSASAADLAARPYTKAPVMVEPIYNWTGFYIGGNVGGVWERDSGTSNFLESIFVVPTNNPQSNSLRSSAAIGGVHAGYNWQISRWVLGVEGDFDWTNAKNGFCRQTDITSLPCTDNGRGFLTLNEKTDWIATARARLGYTWDRFMVYGTGGAAWGKIDTSINANCLVAGCASSVTILTTTQNFSNTNIGWVAGAGIEAMLTQNWIVRAEYLHTDLGNITNTLNIIGNKSATWSRNFSYDTVRTGLSYKFGGPVGASY